MSRSVEEAIDAVAQQVLLDAMGRCNQGNPQQQFRGYKKGDRSWLRDAHERSLEGPSLQNEANLHVHFD
jgi:hypothetical protein